MKAIGFCTRPLILTIVLESLFAIENLCLLPAPVLGKKVTAVPAIASFLVNAILYSSSLSLIAKTRSGRYPVTPAPVWYTKAVPPIPIRFESGLYISCSKVWKKCFCLNVPVSLISWLGSAGLVSCAYIGVPWCVIANDLLSLLFIPKYVTCAMLSKADP